MEQNLMEKEYSSLRDEILKWQDRRVTFAQVSITLVTAYIGYMLRDDSKLNTLSWQIVSIFPILLLSVTMHLTKIFELFQLRISTFLMVFHDSVWENEVGDVQFLKGIFQVGYNKTWAFIYLLTSLSSTYVFIHKYPHPVYSWNTVVFAIFALTFLLYFIFLFRLTTKDEKQKLLEQWQLIRIRWQKVETSSNTDTKVEEKVNKL